MQRWQKFAPLVVGGIVVIVAVAGVLMVVINLSAGNPGPAIVGGLVTLGVLLVGGVLVIVFTEDESPASNTEKPQAGDTTPGDETIT